MQNRFLISRAISTAVLAVFLSACTGEIVVTTPTDSQKTPVVETTATGDAKKVIEDKMENQVREAVSPDTKLTYKLFANEKGCQREFLDTSMTLNCRLQIFENEGNKIILDLKSDSDGLFKAKDQTFKAPDDWLENESLYIATENGDAGASLKVITSFNVRTQDLKEIYKMEGDRADRAILSWNGKKYLATFGSDNKVTIYSIDPKFTKAEELFKAAADGKDMVNTGLARQLIQYDGYNDLDYQIGMGLILRTADKDVKTDLKIELN